jgi:hypothetical protein
MDLGSGPPSPSVTPVVRQKQSDILKVNKIIVGMVGYVVMKNILDLK